MILILADKMGHCWRPGYKHDTYIIIYYNFVSIRVYLLTVRYTKTTAVRMSDAVLKVYP